MNKVEETLPKVNLENFVYNPVSNSFVSTSKLRDINGNTIVDISGYDFLRIAKRIGLNPMSASEWEQSRYFFEKTPDKSYDGKTGSEIEKNFMEGEGEYTSTFMAFRMGTGFTEEVSDLLKSQGFDGKIALIDFPGIDSEENVLTKGPRTRVIDISDILPKRNGYVHAIDSELGIPTAVGENPNSEFGEVWYSMHDLRTKQIIKPHDFAIQSKAGTICLHTDPSLALPFLSTRLSSRTKPLETRTAMPSTDERVAAFNRTYKRDGIHASYDIGTDTFYLTSGDTQEQIRFPENWSDYTDWQKNLASIISRNAVNRIEGELILTGAELTQDNVGGIMPKEIDPNYFERSIEELERKYNLKSLS